MRKRSESDARDQAAPPRAPVGAGSRGGREDPEYSATWREDVARGHRGFRVLQSVHGVALMEFSHTAESRHSRNEEAYAHVNRSETSDQRDDQCDDHLGRYGKFEAQEFDEWPATPQRKNGAPSRFE